MTEICDSGCDCDCDNDNDYDFDNDNGNGFEYDYYRSATCHRRSDDTAG